MLKPTYYPFDPDTRRPAELPPPGSCDSQFHVFGPADRYPPKPDAGYEMPHATIETALAMHRTLGIERGVIVQSTTYGLDHTALLDGLALAGPQYRGCAIGGVLETADDREIARLHEAGVRGARFNFLKRLNQVPTPAQMARCVARARELGWYVKVQPDLVGIGEYFPLFENIDIDVVVDHMGRPDVTPGYDDPSVRRLVDLLGKGNIWVMLSNGHKISRTGPPWDDAVALARRYIERAPDRVIWASDWPHPLSKEQPPNDGDLLDLLYRYADASERQRILVDNPARLFGFDPVAPAA